MFPQLSHSQRSKSNLIGQSQEGSVNPVKWSVNPVFLAELALLILVLVKAMTSVRVAVLCVVVFVGVVWVCGVAGVDRSKFKTCDQSSFCKRNRALSTQPREDTKLTNVLKESLQKHEHKITATLKTENVELPMDITVLQDNIVRLRIYEVSNYFKGAQTIPSGSCLTRSEQGTSLHGSSRLAGTIEGGRFDRTPAH